MNYKDDFRNATFIASQSDTLNLISFSISKSLSFFKRDRDSFIVRRTTQEEDTVLKYKKSNEYYDSNDVKWDKTRIKFPEHLKFAKRPTEH